MIVSIHIPKTAGRSFRMRLEAGFGARAYFDYGDWVGYDTPETVARRAGRVAEMRQRRDALVRDYDLIHGHFIPDKYVDLFPTEFVAFFRDPYQQAVSNYQFLSRNPGIDHPGVKVFHETKPTLTEFIALTPSVQSVFLGSLSIDELAVVGLTEQYERGVALFGAVLGRPLQAESERGNVNPDRPGETYAIEQDVRRAVEVHRGADVELYRRARERFAQLAARYGV